MEFVRILEREGGQVQALADAGGRESQRVESLEHTTHQNEEVVQSMAQRQETGAGSSGERNKTTARIGTTLVLDSLTDKTGFKHEPSLQVGGMC